MFSKRAKEPEKFDNVTEGLKKLYKTKLQPLEEMYRYADFHSPSLEEADFDGKPMVLLIGQYSTGKTSFIKYLIEEEFPGIRIGPEPTTDKFIIITDGDTKTVVPGNALVVDQKRQFRPLSRFGNNFLNRLTCSIMPNQTLKNMTFIDTPGILSGEKQRIDRGYDFCQVVEWFAERVDRIILLFDAHKLDISDEFKKVIERMRNYDEKVRIVLNKADRVDHQQLMRVYGALMWSLGKVLGTPEVTRVYIGSFWDEPLMYDDNRRLFELEEADLLNDLQMLPRNATVRKLNDLIRRARHAKVHAYIIAELKAQMPSMFGKDSKKKELIAGLDKIYKKIEIEHQISPGDFPNIQKMQETLGVADFAKFQPLKQKMIDNVDTMLSQEVAKLMELIPREEAVIQAAQLKAEQNGNNFGPHVSNIFGVGQLEGVDLGRERGEGKGWVVDDFREEADKIFDALQPTNGLITGAEAKVEMIKSKLPNTVLGKIWKLADCDKDNHLSRDEWALAHYLMKLKVDNHELPGQLPAHLIPPASRQPQTVGDE